MNRLAFRSFIQRYRDGQEAGGFRRRILTTGLWSVAELSTSHVLRLASNLLLTRLLMPEAFGLMAMVTTIHVALNQFTDLGIGQSIVRSNRADEPHFLRVTWTLQIVRGAMIAAGVALSGVVLWVLGPILASEGTVFADPRLPPLIIISALSVILESFRSTTIHLANRNLKIARVALLGISAQGFTLLAMFTLASMWPTVWALLAGMILGALYRSAMSHVMLPYPRMGFRRDPELVRELWSFGKWMMLSSTFGFLSNFSDRMILGAFMDSALFGLYVIALTWIGAANALIYKLVEQVGFPALAEVSRGHPEALHRAYRRSSMLLDIICFTGFLVAFSFGDDLIRLLYTGEYHDAGLFVPLLALMILKARFGLPTQLLMLQGRSLHMAITVAVAALGVWSLMIPGYYTFGVFAAVWAAAVGPMVGDIVKLIFLRKDLQSTAGIEWIKLSMILVVAVVVGVTYI